MNQHTREPGADRDAGRLGPIDAVILCVAVTLGGWARATNPKDLESALGLIDAEARIEACGGGRRAAEAFLTTRLLRWNSQLMGFVSMGFAIASLWLIMIAGGFWRTTSHWSDHCGRLVGAGYIFYAIFGRMVLIVLLSHRP